MRISRETNKRIAFTFASSFVKGEDKINNVESLSFSSISLHKCRINIQFSRDKLPAICRKINKNSANKTQV